MRGMGKFIVGHWIITGISLILPVGKPLKRYLIPYILFENRGWVRNEKGLLFAAVISRTQYPTYAHL